MRIFLLLGLISLILADCETPSDESGENPVGGPFAGAPRGYEIQFPEIISMYYTGEINLRPYDTIELANEQYQQGKTMFVSVESQAVTSGIAKNFGPRVGRRGGSPNPTPVGDIVARHPDVLRRISLPHYVNLNTSHPALSAEFRAMSTVPGNFRVRIGNLENCNTNENRFVPWGEFGFSTLPSSAIPLVSVTPLVQSAPGWPSKIVLRFNSPIIIRDVRQIRYEVNLDHSPKSTLVYRFDHQIVSSWWSDYNPSESASRRLLHVMGPVQVPPPVQATPNTPCLPFCEADPASGACRACCTSVVHENPWSCGENSQVRCCKTWDADCWDTPSTKNSNHSCNLCSSKVISYYPPDWISSYETDLVIDNRALAYDSNFPDLRKALMHSAASVKLVVEKGALVDAFSQSVPNAASSWNFRVTRQPKEIKFPLDGMAMRTLPKWLNFTVDAPVTWRCPTEIRAFGIRHAALAGGEVMRPGDLCRIPVVREPPPPTIAQPSSPTSSPALLPTLSPTISPTPSPTRSPTEPLDATLSPSTLSPTPSPTTESPTMSPTTGAPTSHPNTDQPTVGPTTDPLAPQIIPCDEDAYWPVECPYPVYIKLIASNDSTTIAVDTTDELFRQDFRDLHMARGQIAITLDSFALVSANGLSVASLPETDGASLVIGTPSGMALTRKGGSFYIGRNLVHIPEGTVQDFAAIEGSVVPPPRGVVPPISDVIRIMVRLENDTIAKIENLPEPVQMFLPIPIIAPSIAEKWSPCQSQVLYHDATCVWFDETTDDWSTGGCSTHRHNKSQTECRCNHLTDFAVLQALQSCQEVDPMPYYVFAGPFFCIFVYCIWAIAMIVWHRRTQKAGRNSLIGQHLLIAVASMTRALGPLAITPGVSIAATSALFALPYLAKFPSFLLLVFQWATIVHFAMQSGGARKFMMPAFGVVCVLVDLTVVGLFINFHATESIDAIVVGTTTLAVFSGMFAMAFLMYGYHLARAFPKDVSQSSGTPASKTSKNLRGIRFKVQIGGCLFSLLFVMAALCHPIALSFQQQNVARGLTAVTSIFLLADFLSFVLILWLFYPALKSLMKTASRESAGMNTNLS